MVEKKIYLSILTCMLNLTTFKLTNIHKRVITTFVMMLLLMDTIFSITTAPSLYDRDSFVVTSLNFLARRSKLIGIYDSFPTTNSSVFYTLEQIDINELNNIEKLLYNRVLDELNKNANFINNDDFSANIIVPLKMDYSSYFTSDNTSLYRYELDQQYKDVDPWFDLRSQLYYGDNIFGYTQFAAKDRLDYKLSDDAKKHNYNLDSFNNMLLKGSGFEIYQPYKLGLSFGDNNYNFQLGRNRLSMGSGISGNFFIGDNFTKQDYASFSLFSSVLNYTLSVSEFDQQSSSLDFEDVSFNGKNQYRVINRIRFEIFKNLSLSVYQGAIFQVENLNLRMITPFMILHNYFNFSDNIHINGNDEANNILGFQTKWVINNGNEVNLILSFDQIQVLESDDVFPQAYGLLINFINSTPLINGMLNKSLELVYTSPYLYLNEKYDENGFNYNYDHIYGNNYGESDEIGYSGYYYGPNTIILEYSIIYTDLNLWEIGSALKLRIHGTKSIAFNSIYEDTITDTIDRSFIVGPLESIISFTTKGYINLNDYLKIDANISCNTIFNHYHDSNSPIFFNTQAKIGATINII